VKPRRWFVTARLIQWRYMVECGDYFGPFFMFPFQATGPLARHIAEVYKPVECRGGTA